MCGLRGARCLGELNFFLVFQKSELSEFFLGLDQVHPHFSLEHFFE